MSILTKIGQYIPGSENYGQHEKNIAPLLLAAPGLIKAGTSLIGAGARNRELSKAKVNQREREYEYENFDYNQDVGAINNPYAEITNRESERSQRNIDQAQANQLQFQQQSGNFGATGAILAQQNKASEQAGDRITKLRSTGAEYVEKQRQSRIGDKYAQAGEFLASSNNRLAQAKKAKAMAKKQLIDGISSAAGAAAGGLAGGLGGAGGAAKGLTGGAPLGSLGDTSFSSGGYNAASSFLNSSQAPQVPSLVSGGTDFSKFLNP